MDRIRIGYTDFDGNFNPDRHKLIRILRQRYDIVVDNDDPEFVFCGPFGNDFLRYGCPRIFYTGEALAPDFNVYDYAIGFDRISFGNRYLRVPLYFLYAASYDIAVDKHNRPDEFFLKKDKFCNFIVSNGNELSGRNAFFKALDSVKHVDSAGGYLNNMPNGERAPEMIIGFREPYKFTIAFENSIIDGYITEKIIQAWASGTIPIYNGGNGVEEDFNPRAFIDVSKYDSYDECIEYVLSLDSNPEEYLKIAKEPVFDPSKKYHDFEKEILKFFDYIFANKGIYKRNSMLTIHGRSHEETLNMRKG